MMTPTKFLKQTGHNCRTSRRADRTILFRRALEHPAARDPMVQQMFLEEYYDFLRTKNFTMPWGRPGKAPKITVTVNGR